MPWYALSYLELASTDTCLWIIVLLWVTQPIPYGEMRGMYTSYTVSHSHALFLSLSFSSSFLPLYPHSRCQPSAECVPLFNNNDVSNLPESASNDPLRLLGRCVEPCSEDCSNGAQNLQCGTDGHTYYNSCFRTCANIQVGMTTIQPRHVCFQLGHWHKIT